MPTGRAIRATCKIARLASLFTLVAHASLFSHVSRYGPDQPSSLVCAQDTVPA